MAEQTGNIGFEETLWKFADKLRGNIPINLSARRNCHIAMKKYGIKP